MTAAEHEQFTQRLQANLEADERVLALVALGSTAVAERRDAFSDHDFWVIVQPGAKAALQDDIAWLPDVQESVATVRISGFGLLVLYTTGHMVELAISEPHELSEGKLDAYALLFDRCHIGAKLNEIAARSGTRPTAEKDIIDCTRALMAVLTGAGRVARGEYLAAHKYLRYSVPAFLLDILGCYKYPPRPPLGDCLDPWRRWEQIDPAVAAELRAVIELPLAEVAAGLLDLADRELRPVLPGYPVQVAETVRLALQRLTAQDGESGDGGL